MTPTAGPRSHSNPVRHRGVIHDRVKTVVVSPGPSSVSQSQMHSATDAHVLRRSLSLLVVVVSVLEAVAP